AKSCVTVFRRIVHFPDAVSSFRGFDLLYDFFWGAAQFLLGFDLCANLLFAGRLGVEKTAQYLIKLVRVYGYVFHHGLFLRGIPESVQCGRKTRMLEKRGY